jgi:hypothetical protein
LALSIENMSYPSRWRDAHWHGVGQISQDFRDFRGVQTRSETPKQPNCGASHSLRHRTRLQVLGRFSGSGKGRRPVALQHRQHRGIDRMWGAASGPNAASCEDVTTWKPNVTSGASCCRSSFRPVRAEFKRFRRTGLGAEILGLSRLGAGGRDGTGGRGLRIEPQGRERIVQGCPNVGDARGTGALTGARTQLAIHRIPLVFIG